MALAHISYHWAAVGFSAGVRMLDHFTEAEVKPQVCVGSYKILCGRCKEAVLQGLGLQTAAVGSDHMESKCEKALTECPGEGGSEVDWDLWEVRQHEPKPK